MKPLHINAFLDRIVEKYNRDDPQGRPISSYQMTHLSGKLLSLALIAWFAWLTGDPKMRRFYIAFLLITYLYPKLYVNRIKPMLFKTANQSFLQDSVLFLIPFLCLLLWLLRVPLGSGMDLFGLILTMMLGFRRIGCFLGGCCFVLPSRIGVRYPERMFARMSEDAKKNPRLIPTGRVFPIQLVESLFAFALFAGLMVRLWVTRDFSGLTMFWFLWLYSAYRFVSDFFRVSSRRPRYFGGKLSEAQVFSLLLFFACSAIYYALTE